MKDSRTGILVIIVVVIIALGLAVFGPMIFSKKEPPQDMKTTGSLTHTAKGIVESEEEITLSSQIAGVIATLKVKEGDAIRKGQPLVIFDSSKIQAKVRNAEATLTEIRARLRELEKGYREEDVEIAKRRVDRAEAVYKRAKEEYDRLERLYKKDAVLLSNLQDAERNYKVALEELKESQANLQKFQKGFRSEEIEQTRSAVEKAEAELNYYKAMLKDYLITSPVDGVVTEKYLSSGETVDIGTPVLKVIDPSKLRIHAELEETDVDRVKEGQSVEIYTDAYKDRTYTGKVYKLFPSVKRKAQRTFDPMASFDINTQGIYIKLDNYTGLKDGMTVTVRFLK